MIHMKSQDLFSLKNKNKQFRMLSATNFAWYLVNQKKPKLAVAIN